jgi:hypothetical protein
MKTVVCFFIVLFLLNQASYGESERHRSGKHKLWVGLGILGAGVAVGLYGADHVWKDEGGGALFVGIGIAAAGLGVMIYGLHQMKTDPHPFVPMRLEQIPPLNFYAGPTRRGVAGGVAFHW